MSPVLTGADADRAEARADTSPCVPAALKYLYPAAPQLCSTEASHALGFLPQTEQGRLQPPGCLVSLAADSLQLCSGRGLHSWVPVTSPHSCPSQAGGTDSLAEHQSLAAAGVAGPVSQRVP